VSSLEGREAPYPERYRVGEATARQVNLAHEAGRRVVAVGTTVVRALETVTDPSGTTHPGEGWTELVVTPERGVRAVDGLITGWHEPEATHLAMLEAVAGARPLELAYAAAFAEGYLWHEFGDSHLLLRRSCCPRGGATCSTPCAAGARPPPTRWPTAWG
jgi:S-adenosylmethionine:tRNA ribosyltransferase-isomerase